MMSSTPVRTNNAAGEVLPGLWVGNLMSVYNLIRLIQQRSNEFGSISTTNESKEVAVTVISVLSNPNLISRTTKALDEQCRQKNGGSKITSINHIVIPLKDTVDSDLKSILPSALSAIDEALLFDHHRCSDNEDCNHNPQRRICLVHCAKGESRSVAIIVAYLLTRHSHAFTTFDEALQHIRTVRPQAMPNIGFSMILRQMARQLIH
jgi:predicted protein tyrosine phosphatase